MLQFPASDTTPSLPYINIVQTCGKRRDLPNFVDVASVNLRFSRLLKSHIMHVVQYDRLIYHFFFVFDTHKTDNELDSSKPFGP